MNVSERMNKRGEIVQTNWASSCSLLGPETLHDARLEAGLLRDECVPAPRAVAAPEGKAAGGLDVVVI